MKPTPLKNKGWKPNDISPRCFHDYEIKEAIEWLKLSLAFQQYTHEKICNKIDEAFEDIK